MNGLSQWDKLKHFAPYDPVDKWGDPHQIKRELLLELDSFRSYLDKPVYVTSGYREKRESHDGASQHHYGLAADVVVPDFNGHLLDLYFTASRFGFKGIGVYRDWQWKGNSIGGLHLDMRQAPYRATWFCYKNKFGTQEYVALTLETLRGFGVV